MKELEHPQYHKQASTDISKWAALSWGFSIWPYRTVRIILSAVFFWSGISKLFSPESFAIIIEAYGIIPESWVIPVSIGLPAGSDPGRGSFAGYSRQSGGYGRFTGAVHGHPGVRDSSGTRRGLRLFRSRRSGSGSLSRPSFRPLPGCGDGRGHFIPVWLAFCSVGEADRLVEIYANSFEKEM
jgi:hypothetical protein